MAAVLKHWRESASLILVTASKLSRGLAFQLTNTASEAQRTPSKEDYDVLMLKRSSKSKFMPNLYVFPGGVAVDSDFSAEWITLFRKLGQDLQHRLFRQLSEGSSNAAPMFTRKRDAAFSAIPPDVAFRICAIRETFEESGVLLAQHAEHPQTKTNVQNSRGQGSSSASLLHTDRVIKQWRNRVNDDPNEFLKMCLELELIPEIWTLHEWGNWLTPTTAAENRRRFDTVFYICCVDHKPDATDDAAETVNAVWAPPTAILLSHFKKQGNLAPPQIYELSKLLNFRTAPELLQTVSQPGRERTERFFPVIVACKDYMLGPLPGDDFYPMDPDFHLSVNITTYEESLEELSKMYPNHNRTCTPRENAPSGALVQYSIQPQKGHVGPNTEKLNKIHLASKL